MLPPEIFVRTTNASTTLYGRISQAQLTDQTEWGKQYNVTGEPGQQKYQGRLVVPPNQELRCDVLRDLHDTPMAGHPGRDNTLATIE